MTSGPRPKWHVSTLIWHVPTLIWQFKMNDKWTLKPEDACYQLHVELSMPLETVLLQVTRRTPPQTGLATGLST
eukprot:7382958-Prymnesium_polylepis.2